MCGIIGYIGKNNSIPILLNALYRMEYRGYDSAGIAYPNSNSDLNVIKDKGNIEHLDKLIQNTQPIPQANIGIGHTRWATHGKVNKANAHPQLDASNKIAVVHNGIVENYQQLKQSLIEKGYSFQSETDSEIFAHLIAYNYNNNLEEAVRKTLEQIQGPYGIVVLSSDEPDKLIAAAHGSPLIIGKGQGESIVASDVAALIQCSSNVIYLEDGEILMLTANNMMIKNLKSQIIQKASHKVDWKMYDTNKNGYSSHLLKEIYEQKQTFENIIRGHFIKSEGNANLRGLKSIKNISTIQRLVITGMGSSLYAAMIGKYLIEEMAKIPVEVQHASEFRYKKMILDKNSLVIVISQSGETMDTLRALKEAKMQGVQVLSICNVVGSTIARKSDGGFYLHAGSEISVASTKTFSSEIAMLVLIALYLGRSRNISLKTGQEIIKELECMPSIIQKTIDESFEFTKKKKVPTATMR